MNKLVFLGTGCGSKNMLTQEIATSALYFDYDGLKFILDPGPGTLINAKKYNINILDLDGILISHPHPDHCTDANAILTGFGYDKRERFLIANRSCLEMTKNSWPCVSKYHISLPKTVKSMNVGDKIKIKDVSFETTESRHYDCGMGFKISGSRNIGYVGDGNYFNGQEKQYKGCELLIFNVLVPFAYKERFAQHMNTEGVISFLEKYKPKLAIIQHFSEKILAAGIDKQARIIEEKTGVRTVAARDGMAIDLYKLKIAIP